MENEHLVPVELVCTQYHIEVSFIRSLTDFGLIEVVTIGQAPFIHKEHLGELEKMIRFHYELEINIEGIEAISHLLQKVSTLQGELTSLKNRLKAYENG